jgi:hypothetical protein
LLAVYSTSPSLLSWPAKQKLPGVVVVVVIVVVVVVAVVGVVLFVAVAAAEVQLPAFRVIFSPGYAWAVEAPASDAGAVFCAW